MTERMFDVEHPEHPAVPGRWNVVVTAGNVTGSVGAYRWAWLARLRARSTMRFWPGPKTVSVNFQRQRKIAQGSARP